MKILLTGGAGFIGSHIADAYIAAGHEVTILDDLSAGKERNIPPEAEFIRCDITDGGEVWAALSGRHFDLINHHAAQVDVAYAELMPLDDLQRNAVGTLMMLLWAEEHGVPRFIHASSASVYKPSSDPISEGAPLGPSHPYGISKLCAERYVQWSAGHGGPRAVIMRYGNVYGPRGTRGVIPSFIEALSSRRRCLIYGAGEQQRDFIFVEDVARFNLQLTEDFDSIYQSLGSLWGPGQYVVNVGTGRGTSVNELYRALVEMMDSAERVEPLHDAPRSGDPARSVLNVDKAAWVMGFRAQTTLEAGLIKTIAMQALSKGARHAHANPRADEWPN